MLGIIAILGITLVVCVTAVPLKVNEGVCYDNKTQSEVCCPGWRRMSTSLDDIFPIECMPKCNQPCLKGVCAAPNVCKCSSNHILSSWGDCVKGCSATSEDGDLCQGGECKDGKCVCTVKLYTPSADNKYCEPKCVGGCGEGGHCVYPGGCQCSEGYKLDLQVANTGKEEEVPKWTCFPDCGGNIRPCGRGGRCVAPNTCKCLEGYTMVNNKCEDIESGEK